MTPRQMMTCSAACSVALREDTRAGAIYGPYAVVDEQGRRRFVGRLEYAGYADACIYCGDALPRGRAARILRHIAQAS